MRHRDLVAEADAAIAKAGSVDQIPSDVPRDWPRRVGYSIEPGLDDRCYRAGTPIVGHALLCDAGRAARKRGDSAASQQAYAWAESERQRAYAMYGREYADRELGTSTQDRIAGPLPDDDDGGWSFGRVLLFVFTCGLSELFA